ncbi:GNAT family N-acetyltransferase [Nocardia cyriacigeorgica]|uniref:GNAT family N-acetyltransferase n=1 Tax=Nocardia cyriacigeorgica TaxID=135487 RepID=UPI003CC7C46B
MAINSKPQSYTPGEPPQTIRSACRLRQHATHPRPPENVAPQHRRRGYGTEILRQTLSLACDLGIHPALLTCRADNAGSRGVIHACGGLVSAQTRDGVYSYWVCPLVAGAGRRS